MNDFRFLPEARDDLDEIREYIAQDSPDAADRLVDEIVDAVAALAAMPGMGHRRTDLTDLPLRFWAVRSYLMAYAPSETPLLIAAVVDGRRDPETLAAILTERWLI